MSNIREYRAAYRPAEHVWALDMFKRGQTSLWYVNEVNMASDVLDWHSASEADRKLIGGILRAFTLAETHVSDHWSECVCQMCPKHEIVALARMFSYQEAIHAEAYNHLSETLGINEHEAFMADPTAQAKIAQLLDHDDDIVSLGVFAGAIEGMSLMSSFVVLLSFCAEGRFRGLSQILSWSAMDERTHAEAGAKLFREFNATAEQKRKVSEAISHAITVEDAFLRNAYAGHPNPPIPLQTVLEYGRYRAERMESALGISTPADPRKYDQERVRAILELYESQFTGNTSTDTFAQAKSGAGYIAAPPAGESIDWDTL